MGVIASLNLSGFVSGTAALPQVQPMAEAALLFVFLLAAGVTAVASVGFVAWAAYQVLRLIVVLLARVLLLPVARPKPRPAAPTMHVACPDPVCRSVNPDHARFCRQCGRMLRASNGARPA